MPVELKNQFVRYHIGDNGQNLEFLEVRTNRNYLAPEPSPCALIKKEGREFPSKRAWFADGKLTIEFAETDAVATIKVERRDGYFLFTVESVSGEPDELVFLNIPTELAARVDQPFSASVIALNIQTNVEELPGPQTHLWAACYRRFGFAGAQAGLVASPFGDMRSILKTMVSEADGVPHSPYGGPFAMDAEATYGSYLFGTPSLETVDSWIDLCRQFGFTQIDFIGCLNYGDYQPFPHLYPHGYRDVKTVTDRLHEAGILAGLHTMSFSISKACNWVTPVPDPRLAKERTYTLAEDIAADADIVPLVEPTTDLPKYIGYYVRRSKTLQIEDELIEYTEVEDTPPFAVRGCKRGACGTTPRPHKKGTPVHHLKECWGCFAPDGESTLFGEVAARIARVISECGFDFTYLDGLDGVHIIGGEENRWHYGAKFAFEVFKHLQRPVMMEMATFHHHLWFVRSRMQAWDHAIRGHKTFIDLHCRSNDGARRMFMPLHLGWSRVLAWQGPEHEVTYLDDVHYMWSRAIATDASFSLQAVNPAMWESEPWLRKVAPLIRTYEELRRSRYFPESVKVKLREPGAEFHLRRGEDGEWEFQPVQYTRHKVEDAEGFTNIWRVHNKFARQPLQLRIEPLMGCAPYDAPGNIVLADFRSADEFNDRRERIQLLNSGKLYSYGDAAPGLSTEVRPVRRSLPPAMGGEGVVGCWTATNAGSSELVLSSSPDDEFSLLDHAERIYRPREASWVRVGKNFSPPLDLSNHRGMGVWIYGDGQGELVNFRVASLAAGDVDLDHYVLIDFEGWRYVELVEPESERFENYSWPYGRSVYKTYREVAAIDNVIGLQLWFNNVPRGRTVTCYLTPIKAIPLVEQQMRHPSLTIAGRTVTFPVEMESGQYLELRGGGECSLFSRTGELVRQVRPEGEIPVLEAGVNEVVFHCEATGCRPRAWVTVITEGTEVLRR